MNEEQRNHLLESTVHAIPSAIADAAKNRRLHEPTTGIEPTADHRRRSRRARSARRRHQSRSRCRIATTCWIDSSPRSTFRASTACSERPTSSKTSCSSGALEKKYVFGSMNRGGLPGAVFEMDDRFTAYTAESIVKFNLDGGKMLLRINLEDAGHREHSGVVRERGDRTGRRPIASPCWNRS